MSQRRTDLGNRKANWLREFEELVVAKRPSYAGRIEWDTPIHFYNRGYSTAEAAEMYINRKSEI